MKKSWAGGLGSAAELGRTPEHRPLAELCEGTRQGIAPPQGRQGAPLTLLKGRPVLPSPFNARASPGRRLLGHPGIDRRAPAFRQPLRCDLCNRADAYRLARLAVKFGAEILPDDLLVRLSTDCPWRDDPRGSWCGVYFADLPPRRPPDIPVRKRLRVISGGKN